MRSPPAGKAEFAMSVRSGLAVLIARAHASVAARANSTVAPFEVRRHGGPEVVPVWNEDQRRVTIAMSAKESARQPWGNP